MSSDEEEFAAQLRSQTLAAFGVKAWDAGLAPVPWHVRIWRAVTFTYRRAKAVNWCSYNAAEAEFRAEQEAFRAALPGRMQDAADEVNRLFADVLPEGMRFEWGPEEAP